MKDIFAFVGLIATLATIFMLCGMFIVFILEKIRDLQRRYECKHRFNKPPIAKCYCKDCCFYAENSWSIKDGHCDYLNLEVISDCFCCNATIKK